MGQWQPVIPVLLDIITIRIKQPAPNANPLVVHVFRKQLIVHHVSHYILLMLFKIPVVQALVHLSVQKFK